MSLSTDAESNLFSSIAGLPLHPLVVHLAVVVLPAAALALIVIVAMPRWRRPYGLLAVGAALVGTGGAFLAKESGEALAAQVGLPATHALWGDRLFVAALVFAIVAVAWFALDLRARRRGPADAGSGAVAQAETRPTSPSTRSGLARLTGGLLVAVSLAVLALTVVVGHSGATAAWGGRVPSSSSANPPAPDVGPVSAPSTPSPSRTPSGTASGQSRAPRSGATTTHPAGHTLAEVRRHRSTSSCWVAIDGGVYDLTKWIDRHPGGPDAISGICGTDASSAFAAQHAGQRAPSRKLATFAIGKLR